jgi:hypothetical protein
VYKLIRKYENYGERLKQKEGGILRKTSEMLDRYD